MPNDDKKGSKLNSKAKRMPTSNVTYVSLDRIGQDLLSKFLKQTSVSTVKIYPPF